MGDYDHTYRQWREDPEGFWRAASTEIDWDRTPDAIFDRSMTSSPAWFPGGELNTCFNALDRHVRDGRGEQAALIYDSPVTGVVRRHHIGSSSMRWPGSPAIDPRRRQSRRSRGDLHADGPRGSDRDAGVARLGAIHSVVFGGFGADELAARIADSGARIVVCASCGIAPAGVTPYKPLVDRALELLDGQQVRCIMSSALKVRARFSRAGCRVGSLHGWGLACAMRTRRGNDPLYILYTSGTTGLPKGIVRDNGGHADALEWSMQAVYGVSPGGVLGRIGYRLGRRPSLHRLRAAATRMHDRPLRGQAGRDARRRRVLARLRRPSRVGDVHRPDRDPRDQARGPVGPARGGSRSQCVSDAVPGRRALRSGHAGLAGRHRGGR